MAAPEVLMTDSLTLMPIMAELKKRKMRRGRREAALLASAFQPTPDVMLLCGATLEV